jgi:hypothetical protein
MATLFGTTPQNTYPSLIKFNDNNAIAASLKLLSDGSGNATPLYISQTQVNVGGSGLVNATLGIKGADISSGSYSLRSENSDNSAILLFSNSGNLLISTGSGTSTLSGTRLTTNSIGVNNTSPTATLQVKGTGTTSATTSLLVQNSAASDLLKIQDDGVTTINTVNIDNGLKLINTGTANNKSGISFQYNIQTFDKGRITCIAGSNGSRLLFSVERLSSMSDVMTIDETSSVNIGNPGARANASSLLDLVSVTRGFLPPRMTTTQVNAIATPAAGLIVYNTTLNVLCCYDGTSWLRVSMAIPM